jgi:hypothetical protein
MSDWYETEGLIEGPEIKIYYSNDSDEDCRREGTYTIVDGKEVVLASHCLPSNVDKETREEAVRIFGESVRLKYERLLG